jgi:quinol-cytochrome oxidoreductase complex cytochrome b subunit
MSAPQSTLGKEFVAVQGEDARQTPVRLLVVQGDQQPAVHVDDEPMVMTFPHLMLRELIAFLAFSLFLVLLALFFDAPLEEIANPLKTPNPAKAPWYFLGLQELLHYYPPVVAGVLLPALVALSLAIIPYFEINLQRAPLWPESGGRATRSLGIAIATAMLSAVFLLTGAHPVWPIVAPLWLVVALMGIAGAVPWRWLRSLSLAVWVFVWFLLSATALTVIGTFFRGPGWAFTLPWRDGIY